MRTRLLALLLLGVAALPSNPVWGESDAKLGRPGETVSYGSGTINLYQSQEDDSKYYYLPKDVLMSKDKDGHPEFMLMKYNLPDTTPIEVADPGSDKKITEARGKGGVLSMVLTYNLTKDELSTAEKNLRKKLGNLGATISLIKIEKATVTIEIMAPGNDGSAKVSLPPEEVSVTGGVCSFMIPLSQNATTLLWAACAEPSSASIVRAVMSFEYSGWSVPFKVKVSMKKKDVFEHESMSIKAEGGFSFFKASADYSKVVESLKKSGALKIDWFGVPPPDDSEKVKEMVDLVTAKLMEMLFDQEDVKNMKEDPAAATIPEANPTKKFGGFSVGVGFAMKKKKITNESDFSFDFSQTKQITVLDRRFSRFSEMSVDPKNEANFKRHLRAVGGADWVNLRPLIQVKADFDKYTDVTVTIKYDDAPNPGDRLPVPTTFKKDGVNFISPREWNLGKGVPNERIGEYSYKVQAILSGKAYAGVPFTKFPKKEMDWKKTTIPNLYVTEADWGGFADFLIKIAEIEDFETMKAEKVQVQMKLLGTLDDDPPAETFIFKGETEKKTWTDRYLAGDKAPKYEATIYWFKDGGKKQGPFKIKQGAFGADKGKLTFSLGELQKTAMLHNPLRRGDFYAWTNLRGPFLRASLLAASR